MYIYIHTHIIQFSCIFWWLSGKKKQQLFAGAKPWLPEQMAWHEEGMAGEVAASGTSQRGSPSKF